MGANLSTTVNVVDQKELNKTINKYMQETTNDVKNTIGSNQINQIEIGKDAVGCDINMTNTSSVHAIAKGTISSESTTDFQNALKSQISNDFSKAAKQKSGFGIGYNVDTTVNKIHEEVDNTIENTVTQKNIQDIMNTIYTVQENKLVIGPGFVCKGSKITLNNDSVIESFASAFSKSIMDAISNNDTLNDISAKFKETVSQVNDIFAGLGGFIVIAAIIAAVAGGGAAIGCGLPCNIRPEYLKAPENNKQAFLASCEKNMSTCKSKTKSHKRTKMIMIALIIIAIIIIGLLIWWKVKSKHYKPETGEECYKTGTDASIKVLKYSIDSSGKCVANTCNEILGYEMDSSGTCELKSGWTDPLVDGAECSKTASDTLNFCTDDLRKSAESSAKMKDNNICIANKFTECGNCKDGKTHYFCGDSNSCDSLCA